MQPAAVSDAYMMIADDDGSRNNCDDFFSEKTNRLFNN